MIYVGINKDNKIVAACVVDKYDNADTFNRDIADMVKEGLMVYKSKLRIVRGKAHRL
jgi:hypothetical protein